MRVRALAQRDLLLAELRRRARAREHRGTADRRDRRAQQHQSSH